MPPLQGEGEQKEHANGRALGAGLSVTRVAETFVMVAAAQVGVGARRDAWLVCAHHRAPGARPH